jgi:hypothetical protein
MRRALEFFFRPALMLLAWRVWWWALSLPLSHAMNLFLIVGSMVLAFPVVWLGRRILDRHQTGSGAAWTTTFLHFALGCTLGISIVRALVTHQDWPGWALPVPPGIGLALVIVTGAVTLLTVVNLALRGFGAPFFIVLSRKLAADWLYGWTRNPMAVAALAFSVSLGIWFQSSLFLLWVLLLFAPALITFLKRAGIGDPIRGIVSGVQIQNTDVVS